MSSVPTGPGSQCPKEAAPADTLYYIVDDNRVIHLMSRLINPSDYTEYVDYYVVAMYDDATPAKLSDWYISEPLSDVLYRQNKLSANWDGASCPKSNGRCCIKSRPLFTSNVAPYQIQIKNKQNNCCIA